MVLEGATASSDLSQFSDEQVPVSDADRYGDQQATAADARKSGFPFDPGFVNISMMNPRQKEVFKKAMQHQLKNVQEQIHRPLTQLEANVLADHYSIQYKYYLYGGTPGVLAGAALLYRRYHSKVGKEAEQRMMNFLGSLPGLRSYFDRMPSDAAAASKRSLTLGIRLPLWLASGWILGKIFMGTIGGVVSQSHVSSDPRLEGVQKAIREDVRSRIAAQRASTTTQSETFEQRRQRISVQDMARNSRTTNNAATAPARPGNVDDASPTGGAFEADFLDSVSEPRPWNGNDTADRMSGTQGRSGSAEDPSQRARNSGYSSNAGSSRPSQQAANTNAGSADNASGSAWERLRQEALGGKNGPGST